MGRRAPTRRERLEARLAVAAAELNATLWEHRHPGAGTRRA
jgi:hypothetical protein